MDKWPIRAPEEFDAKSMTSEETFKWLSEQGLDFDAKWSQGDPVLMIIPEFARSKVINDPPSLLVPSFVVIRRPRKVIQSEVSTMLHEVELDQRQNREYDIYSLAKDGEVFLVEKSSRRVSRESYFLSDHMPATVNAKNRSILAELGCNFDW